jgi:hypothetical protein
MRRLDALTDRRFKDGFRETFLFLFTRKGDAAALRRVCMLLSDLYQGIDPRQWPAPKDGELKGLVLAAVRDLRHVRDVMLWIDAGHGFDGYSAAVADLVGRCGADLEKIAVSIEDGMADLPQLYDEYMRALDERAGIRSRESAS